MDTAELTQRLAELERCNTQQEQEDAFNALNEEISADNLEVVIDEDHCFAVRVSSK